MADLLGNQREEEGIKKVVKKENPDENGWHWCCCLVVEKFLERKLGGFKKLEKVKESRSYDGGLFRAVEKEFTLRVLGVYIIN